VAVTKWQNGFWNADSRLWIASLATSLPVSNSAQCKIEHLKNNPKGVKLLEPRVQPAAFS
jgi:hypothetical protein